MYDFLTVFFKVLLGRINDTILSFLLAHLLAGGTLGICGAACGSTGSYMP
ncbi:MAG: hypothetical protein ACOH2E_04555 [Candidatus Paracaedibacter sp.]